MKFCKKYQQFMQEHQQKELPGVGFKKLKKILKKCRRRRHETTTAHHDASSTCPHHCAVCDGTFFSSLLNEMSAVVGCFNERAQKLLELHLASGVQKWLLYFKNKQQKNHGTMIQEGNNLVTYAMINAVAIRKILKKYDKVHYSKQGQAFKSQAQSLHIEILQSPWLCELIAFHINLRETKGVTRTLPGLFKGFSLTFEDGKPSLSCALLDSVELDIELTCSICLDTVFDPVSLTCGHIFCYICACSSASVNVVDGLKIANSKAKCPLCRESRFIPSVSILKEPVCDVIFVQRSCINCAIFFVLAFGRDLKTFLLAGVFEGAVHLEELNILLSRSCSEYWKERLQSERVERVKQAKEYWESQSRAVMGI